MFFFLIIFSSSISNLLSLCVFSLSFRRFSSFLTCFFSSCLRLFLFSIFFFFFFGSSFLPPFYLHWLLFPLCWFVFFSSSFCLLPYPMYVLSSNFLFSPLRHRCFFCHRYHGQSSSSSSSSSSSWVGRRMRENGSRGEEKGKGEKKNK